MAKSEYLETLEKLQNALTQFDMSFGVSNRIFRLALVSEILDTVCLFEQLYESWSEYLPYGEGPDADVDFAYWKELSTWDTLLNSAKQNVCIDDFPLDMGNGVTSDRIHGNRRKTYLKTINGVLRHSKYAGKESTSAFVKTINSDKTHMITFGNMVFDALSSLLLVFSKIETLLSNPPQELFLNFYEMQYNRFCEEWLSNRVRIVEILHEDLSDKRKCNKLYALKDEVWKNLYESNFLDALKDGINIYDIHDYQKEHPDTSKTEDEIREVLALAELVDNENRPYKEKVGKYIFEHRKSLSYEDICTFFVYLDAVPDIFSNIEKLKEENCDETAAIQPPAENSKSETEQANPVVDAIKEQTEQDNPASPLNSISPFTPAVIDTTKAVAVIALLRQLMEGKTKPKDVLMPVRAAMDAGVIRRPTWEEFCQEFGSYRLKSKTSFSDYTNPDKSPYTGADFQMMKEKFRQLMSDGQ